MQVRSKAGEQQAGICTPEMAAWMRGRLQRPGKRKGRERRRPGAARTPLRGRCVRDGIRGIGQVWCWLDRALRLRLGNEGLEQGMTGWNVVLVVVSGEEACLWWEKHGCLVAKLGGLGMQ
jgi:hypothetical protein